MAAVTSITQSVQPTMIPSNNAIEFPDLLFSQFATTRKGHLLKKINACTLKRDIKTIFGTKKSA